MFSYDFLGGDYKELDEPVFVLFSYDKLFSSIFDIDAAG